MSVQPATPPAEPCNSAALVDRRQSHQRPHLSGGLALAGEPAQACPVKIRP
jgi:hypothetical protein